MTRRHNVIIAGSGLAALATAARLTELGVRDIAIYTHGLGATPYVAAINFVLPGNPYGDTPEQYCQDMLHTGYDIADPELVADMAAHTVEGYELLRRWGVTFAYNDDGSIKLRHVSGHTYPRSLCQTTKLIGQEIVDVMIPRLKDAGVEFYTGCEVVQLLSDGGVIDGITVKEKDELYNVYAPAVIAAWGGVGNLLGESTYPGDIRGNTLGMAKLAGADLIDMEFLEFEPMVVQTPPGARGEPAPTAMLGEGGYLLNSDGERFLLKVRPQGEGGAPKSLINREVWKQVNAGKGSPNNGVYLDLRHIDRKVLEGYPWFLERLLNAGCDPSRELIEVAPMAHSFSGGIKINRDYESTVRGLYAVGEACGGIHGACRCAGNAGSQACLSGLICAEAVARNTQWDRQIREHGISYVTNLSVRARLLPELQKIAAGALGIFRDGAKLQEAQARVQAMRDELAATPDSFTEQSALAIDMIIRAALLRQESRGTHNRIDYPDMDPAFQKEITI